MNSVIENRKTPNDDNKPDRHMSLGYSLKGAEKSLLQAAQKDPGARRAKIDERRRTYSTLSDAIERQRSIWVFFSSLLSAGFFSRGFAFCACMFEFGIDFTAHQNDESADVHPG